MIRTLAAVGQSLYARGTGAGPHTESASASAQADFETSTSNAGLAEFERHLATLAC